MRIDISGLVFEYPSGPRALDGVDLVLEGTDPVAIVGQNGAGKTTLVKHLNGILRPTAGSVSVDGVDIEDRTTAQWSAYVGYVFQNPDNQLFLESVRSEFEFGPKQLGVPDDEIQRRLEWVAELTGMSDKLDRHPADLSPTEKKFCAMGTVIMMDPDVVIFDEPTCGQDLKGVARLARVIDELRRLGKLCITISHDTKFVTRYFPRTVVMCQGKVLTQGSTQEVFERVDLLRQSFVIPPPVARVAREAGIERAVFDVDALIEAVIQEKGKGN
ncbi:MAG: ABC transporter ATP-binding protein [Collinsella sp.]|nr:ABC transporter ATP-binding protein [Collinsella sp.]